MTGWYRITQFEGPLSQGSFQLLLETQLRLG